jgi:hypothetical protein
VRFRLVCLFLVGSLPGVIGAEGPAIQPARAATPFVSVVSTPIPQFAILKQPVKIKILYGETVIPAGTRLPVVSVDSTTVRVKYMGDVQTIPITAAQFESAPVDQHLPAPPAAVVPPEPNGPQAPAAAPPQITIALPAGWDTRMQGGDITMRELQSILSRYCSPGVDLSGADSPLYNDVRYLMDANQAIRILNLPRSLPSHGQVITPGFPRSSLSFSTFDGMFEGQFNRLDLVTDAANKVVCIQMVDEHSRSSDLPDADDTWNTYNFIHSGLRASDTMKVAIKSEREGDVIRIETRLFQHFRHRVGRSVTAHTEVKQKTKLLLPIPFARIILHCVQTGLSK